jgi:L-lactate dehydrogenase (cytochrome)
MNLERILSLQDFEAAARRHLPRPLFGYIEGAAETNASRADNRAAFQDYAFIPRALVNTSKRSLETTLFGRRYALPFGICPMGLAGILAYRGELVLARAAAKANLPMVLAGSTLIRLEEVRAEGPTAWFQAYLPGEPDRIAALVERIARAGYDTLVLTVDTMVLGNRENNVRNGFSTPLRPSLGLAWQGVSHPRWLVSTFLRTLVKHGMPHFENSYAERGAPILSRSVMRDFGARDHLDWRHCEQIRRQWSGRFLLKGVVDPEDARIARESGVDGVIVSNHGGRQLDGMVAPLRVLPAVVAASKEMPVLLDGGIRRGTDILKAYALGAKFVFVGRPFMYAAAVAGEPGVAHAIGLLADEVFRDIGLMGVNSPGEMAPERLLRLPPSARA